MAHTRDTKPVASESKQKFRLTMSTINPYVRNMEYAVRGRLPQEAAKIEAAIHKVRDSSLGMHGGHLNWWKRYKEVT